jgi:ADP-heptose:LPS heptosyltransferase
MPDALAEIRHKYNRRDVLQSAVFRGLDTLLSLILKPFQAASAATASPPERILVANAGHLGDLVLSTALMHALRVAFPNARIGVLAGHWGKTLFADHPLIWRLHSLTHWYVNRASIPRHEKIRVYFRDRRRVVQELRECRYDIAFDVRMWFPNFIPVIWSARVPIRVGFTRIGFSALLTNPVEANLGGIHEVESQLALLKTLGSAHRVEGDARLILAPTSDVGNREVAAVLGGASRPYRVLHLGSSTATKNWPTSSWAELAGRLQASGHRLVFTGTGAGERENIAAATAQLANFVNACDRLSWQGLVELIRGAELVYSIDTSVGHVASAVQTPVVTIYGGTAEPARWRPYGSGCRVVTFQPECFPCLRKQGCRQMTCLTQLPVEAVYAAGEDLLAVEIP